MLRGKNYHNAFKPYWTFGSPGLSGESVKSADHIIWCQWTCQSNLFPSAMGQMAGHWDTDKCTHHIWQLLMLFLGLFHLFHPFSVFLWFWVHLSLLSLFIPFHFLLVSSVSSHNLEFQQCPLSFSFIKRSAHVVHTWLHPALVSLWAGVGGKSGLGAFMHLLLHRE